MKKWHWLTLGAIVLIVILVASLSSGGPKGEKVYVEPVKRRDIESVVSAPGEVDPRVKVNISAHVIGKIEKLYFKEGDTVRKGQRLVELERVAYVAQRARMASMLANGRIEARRARVNLRNAETQYRRAQRLQEQGISAQELFDRSQLDLENSRAAVASAEEGVRQAAAGLAQAEEDLARTTIVAPIDGKIVQLSAHEGEVVITGTMNNPGSVIAVIADLSEILIEAEVGETEVVRMRVGQPAKIKVDAVQDFEYLGQVAEIGSSATAKAGSSGLRYFTVKVALGNADERLRPGMTAQVEIITESAKKALSVPVQSVVERAPGSKGKKDSDDDDPDVKKLKYVFVAEKDKAKMVQVTTGINNATHVAIASGLKEGDPVVTGPFRVFKKLKDGHRVVPESEKKRIEDEKKESDEKDEKESS